MAIGYACDSLIEDPMSLTSLDRPHNLHQIQDELLAEYFRA
jgi:hypothetical protein